MAVLEPNLQFGQKNPEIVEQKTLAQELWEVLEESNGRENINQARRERQKKVLEKLGSNFESEMRAAYINSESSRGSVYGDLFESLVLSDEVVTTEPETELASTIRSIMHIPEMYGLKEFGISHVKNPDNAKLDEKGEIIAAIEVKGKPLDLRACSQLEHFSQNFIRLFDRLKRVGDEDLKEHGLQVIAQNKDKLRLSKDFKVTLVIPAMVYNGDLDSIIDKSVVRGKNLNRLRSVLTTVKIIESAFSPAELFIMNDYIVNKFIGEKKER